MLLRHKGRAGMFLLLPDPLWGGYSHGSGYEAVLNIIGERWYGPSGVTNVVQTEEVK